jgi:hypothetical protein
VFKVGINRISSGTVSLKILQINLMLELFLCLRLELLESALGQ